MYAFITLNYWNMCLNNLGKAEFGPQELQQTADLFAKALEMAEKHLAREPDDPDSEIVETLALIWDDASDGLDGIAPIGIPLLQRLHALRQAVSDDRQMAALLYCLRGVQAFYASKELKQESAKRESIEGRAIPAFQEALRCKPGYTGAQERLEQLQQMAVEARAIRHYNRGLAYGEQQQLDECIREFEAALEINPGFVEARDNLAIAHANRGMVYEDEGRLDAAIQEARLAVQMGFERAREMLDRLEAKKAKNRPAQKKSWLGKLFGD